MRLLRARTVSLEPFFDDRDLPPYAVLSHTWGSDEVSFHEIQQSHAAIKSRAGYQKILGCCRQALRDGLEHVWVDTCCIDKSSSAELSEAINSMFRWYQNAQACYAYLHDVPADPERLTDDSDAVYSAFRECRWFTRGWTLQELLAPGLVQFFDTGWFFIGTKISNIGSIEKVTGIGRRFLKDAGELKHASVAQRMSWAAYRKTTRIEDQAYCLLGIFGINMPLLYGEGDKAFIRLQEEIMKESDDQSLFAWGMGFHLDHEYYNGGLFASSPLLFAHCSNIIFWGQLSTQRPTHYYMTNKGLRVELPMVSAGEDSDTAYAVLDCLTDMRFIVVPLSRAYHDDVFQRTRGSVPRTIPAKIRKTAVRKLIYLQKELPSNSLTMYFSTTTIRTTSLNKQGYRLVDAHPPHAILKFEPDAITCGDSHQILLLFQRDQRQTLALLITATYKTGEHDFSRPLLEDMRYLVAPGPKARRFAQFVLDHGLGGRLHRALKFGNSAVVGSDRIAPVVEERTHAGWVMLVDVDSTSRTRMDSQLADVRFVSPQASGLGPARQDTAVNTL
jgi:hypothetical protein